MTARALSSGERVVVFVASRSAEKRLREKLEEWEVNTVRLRTFLPPRQIQGKTVNMVIIDDPIKQEEG